MYVTDLNVLKGCNYEVIAADPPWTYTNVSCGGSGTSGAQAQYPVMDLKAICALPVKEITAPTSVLFLWTTMPLLKQSFDVMEAWGFKYKTNAFTWVKRNKKSEGWFWGMGYWTRSNAELCLMGVKGKPVRQSTTVHSVIDAPIQTHSQKPAEYRDRIVQLMGNVPRLEMFSRGDQEDGWDRWGNEPEGPRTIIPHG